MVSIVDGFLRFTWGRWWYRKDRPPFGESYHTVNDAHDLVFHVIRRMSQQTPNLTGFRGAESSQGSAARTSCLGKCRSCNCCSRFRCTREAEGVVKTAKAAGAQLFVDSEYGLPILWRLV